MCRTTVIILSLLSVLKVETVVQDNPGELDEIFENLKDTVTVVNGSAAELDCLLRVDLKSDELSNVTWLRAPRQILTRGIFRVTEDTRISIAPLVLLQRRNFGLFIRPVLQEDRGEYRCAVNLKDKVYVREVSLEVLVPPRIIRIPAPFLKVDEGARLEIDCLATGYPPPETTWLVENPQNELNNEQSMDKYSTVLNEFSQLGGKIINIKGTLKISKLHRKMNRRLICLASNGVAPNDRRTVDLCVRFPPNVTMANRVIKQEVGMNTVLTCSVIANPPGSVQWYFNHRLKITASSCDVLIKTEKKYCLQEHQPIGDDVLAPISSKLTIFHLTPDDFGDYVCSVNTLMGETYGVTSLKRIKKTLNFDPPYPRLPETFTHRQTTPSPIIADAFRFHYWPIEERKQWKSVRGPPYASNNEIMPRKPGHRDRNPTGYMRLTKPSRGSSVMQSPRRSMYIFMLQLMIITLHRLH